MYMQFKPMPVRPTHPPHPGGTMNVRPGYDKALNKLRYELGRIDAKEVVIEAGFSERQIRPTDGLPRGDQRPAHPVVRVTWKMGNRPMSLVCGIWSDYVKNIYMIAMTLESMRAIERYGCVQGQQQYSGFAALPPGVGIPMNEWPNVEAAFGYLASIAGSDCRGRQHNAELLDELFQAAARNSHHDTPGGSVEKMAKVNRARAYIREAMK